MPEDYVKAWERAKNRSTCALLVPTDGGPEMPGATATSQPTPDDRGWDVYLRKTSAIVEILGLFDKSSQPESQATPAFTRAWSDGSVARYGADVGTDAGGDIDPAATPFEATLTLPDQSCAYRIYDTLGKAHLESIFDRLRFVKGAGK